MGNINAEKGHFEEACVSFLEYLVQNPNDDKALCNLGMALGHLPQYDSLFANLAFEEAMHLSPSSEFIIENYLIYLLESE